MHFKAGTIIRVHGENFHAIVQGDNGNGLEVQIVSSVSGKWFETWNREHTEAALERGDYYLGRPEPFEKIPNPAPPDLRKPLYDKEHNQFLQALSDGAFTPPLAPQPEVLISELDRLDILATIKALMAEKPAVFGMGTMLHDKHEGLMLRDEVRDEIFKFHDVGKRGSKKGDYIVHFDDMDALLDTW